MKKVPRVIDKLYFLIFSAFALFMGVSAGKVVLPASYDNVPPVILPFFVVFLSAWFGFVAIMFFYGLTALQSVEMDRDEIRICIGSLVIRRISTDRIKTVGMSVIYNRGYTAPRHFMLVLSSKSAEELNEKGDRWLKKTQMRDRMFRAGVMPEGKYAAAKAYLFEHFERAPLWIEDSEEAREMLRKCLTTAVFLI